MSFDWVRYYTTKRLSVIIGKRKERGTMKKQKKDRLTERQKMIRKILNVPPSKHFKRVIALASSISENVCDSRLSLGGLRRQ